MAWPILTFIISSMPVRPIGKAPIKVDENLIDAIILKATRIGHGFAIGKHPSVMDLARTNSVAVEICPISNQVYFSSSL